MSGEVLLLSELSVSGPELLLLLLFWLLSLLTVVGSESS